MLVDHFSLTHTETDGVHVVHCHGELDIAAAELLRTTVSAHARRGPVVVDASDVSFLDCAGLSSLFAAARLAAEHDYAFAVASPSRTVLRLLDVTHTLDVVNPHPSVHSAVRACRRQSSPA